MENQIFWPNELKIHYKRLPIKYRKKIIEETKEKTFHNEDILKRFFRIVQKKIKNESKKQKSNNDFLFFLLELV
jgi:hypothetical protein